MSRYGYVDVDKLIEYANNCRVGLDANDIARFPKADVRENVHGEWLPKWSEFFKRTLPYCSRCLQGFFFETDFCPNCGADMRKGAKNELPEMRK